MKTLTPTIIHVTRFQPFESRIGIDTVVRLDFHYDPKLIGHLKRILANYRPDAVDPGLNRQTPGGWLPREKCWFVESIVWDVMKVELSSSGYAIREGAV